MPNKNNANNHYFTLLGDVGLPQQKYIVMTYPKYAQYIGLMLFYFPFYSN